MARSIPHGLLRSITLALALIALLWLMLAQVRPSQAAGVVGPPCNMFTLGAAMNSGSGEITFNCGGPATIVITQTGGLNVLAGQGVFIPRGGGVTVGGVDSCFLFYVESGGAGPRSPT